MLSLFVYVRVSARSRCPLLVLGKQRRRAKSLFPKAAPLSKTLSKHLIIQTINIVCCCLENQEQESRPRCFRFWETPSKSVLTTPQRLSLFSASSTSGILTFHSLNGCEVD